jgi:fructokinase
MDVITCGELLIDFVSLEANVTLAQATTFKKAFGGAPANVAVGVARLGCAAGFMGKVGDDDFGHFLAGTLREDGIDIRKLIFTDQARTALAFVSLRSGGERDFMFYRHPSADMLWHADDVDRDYIAQARIFHYGSISLISEPARNATLTALKYAGEAGVLRSYDPNLRLPLWSSAEAARVEMLNGWRYADIIKVSEDELTFLTGKDNLEFAARSLWHDTLRLLVVTRGSAGCTYFTSTASGHVPSFSVHAIDTTGAGDGFVAGMLVGLLESDLAWDVQALEKALVLGSAVGALTTTQLGAISALPTMAEVQSYLHDKR